ncbi:hypothetical protein C884_00549 [Kocuria palustris PEL]|uniref:Uncharacterized protein n=1 Tax=Kocuria palustris PEL TaxID=1236550 RepID=M2XBD5_9MICC|nr:hypothetical protein C884_00549 [Kocuria palustris PEL]
MTAQPIHHHARELAAHVHVLRPQIQEQIARRGRRPAWTAPGGARPGSPGTDAGPWCGEDPRADPTAGRRCRPRLAGCRRDDERRPSGATICCSGMGATVGSALGLRTNLSRGTRV